MATSYTIADQERLERAIAQGVLTVTFADGRSVTFSTFDELTRRLALVKRELGEDTGRQRLFAEFRKGVE